MLETTPEEPLNLLSRADAMRRTANGKLRKETKSAFAQYMTPAKIASFMASLYPVPMNRSIRLLDPGAGMGILTSAFVEHVCKIKTGYHIEVDAYEIDSLMRSYLEQNLNLCATAVKQRNCLVTWRVYSEDFITEASMKVGLSKGLWAESRGNYTHCIMNPPYKKIPSASLHRACLRNVGIETVNLYSAFVALALFLLEKGGYLTAIIPRSFCNGPYYRPFRELMLKHAALRRIHLFVSRSKAFKEDKVIQENIILSLEKEGKQKEVTVSISTDDTFSDISIYNCPFKKIVRENDRDLIIHIPTTPEADLIDVAEELSYSLSQLGIQVSTGPVVDFRMRDQLMEMPGPGGVPLLYPCHFKGRVIQWPIENGKKPNAILSDENTEKWLLPNGYYTVVRRFSSKEERRRIVASVVDPAAFAGADKIGLENHLNVYHCDKKPLSEVIARGLAVFLNSTAVDCNFRRFSGNTQVNAADLRNINYPSYKILTKLGKWAIGQGELTQDMIDKEMERVAK